MGGLPLRHIFATGGIRENHVMWKVALWGPMFSRFRVSFWGHRNFIFVVWNTLGHAFGPPGTDFKPIFFTSFCNFYRHWGLQAAPKSAARSPKASKVISEVIPKATFWMIFRDVVNLSKRCSRSSPSVICQVLEGPGDVWKPKKHTTNKIPTTNLKKRSGNPTSTSQKATRTF